MESFRQDVFIDIVVDMFIFKNNQITLSPVSRIHTQNRVYLKQGSFYCVSDVR